MRIGRNYDQRRFPFKAFNPPRTVFIKIKSKTGKPHPVKHTFEQSRHSGPPAWIQNDEMISPFYILLNHHKIRLKLLYFFVSFVENWVKFELGYINPLHFVTRF